MGPISRQPGTRAGRAGAGLGTGAPGAPAPHLPGPGAQGPLRAPPAHICNCRHRRPCQICVRGYKSIGRAQAADVP